MNKFSRVVLQPFLMALGLILIVVGAGIIHPGFALIVSGALLASCSDYMGESK